MLQEQILIDKQTELMKKYGPQETSYCVSWHKEDEELVNLYFKKADRIKENSHLIIDFMNQLERKFNDHPAYILFKNKRIYLNEISKALDIPTIQGVQFCMRQIIVGGSLGGLSPWRYMAAGSDKREARSYQDHLFAETLPRADMNSSGSITRVAESIEFVGNFPNSFPTITVTESAIWNTTDNNGTNLNRNMFKLFPIAHTSGGLPFTLATNINFIPDITWG
jgi:hypothetical protein